MEKSSRKVTVVSVIIVLFLVALFAVFIRGAIFGDGDKSNDNVASKIAKGDSKNNPINIPSSDLKSTGAEFAKKYSGKFISFDGLIQGTSTLQGAAQPHSMLLYGDNAEKGALADGSLFWVTASSSTFGSSLSEYATPNERKDYVKVHVVAQVKSFSETYSVVQLEPIVNVDGKTPSVTKR